MANKHKIKSGIASDRQSILNLLVLFLLLAAIYIVNASTHQPVHTPAYHVQMVPGAGLPSSQAALNSGDQKTDLKTFLPGSWQRLPDRSQIVNYSADGTAKVFSGKNQTDSFNWQLTSTISDSKFTSKPGNLFIKESSGTGADRYYLVQKLDNNSLEILYTYNGKVLKYERLP